MKLGFLVGAAVGLAMGIKASEKQNGKIHGALHKVRSLPIVASSLDAAGEKVGQVVRTAGHNLTERAVNRVQQSVFGMKDPLVVESGRVRVEQIRDTGEVSGAHNCAGHSGRTCGCSEARGEITASNPVIIVEPKDISETSETKEASETSASGLKARTTIAAALRESYSTEA